LREWETKIEKLDLSEKLETRYRVGDGVIDRVRERQRQRETERTKKGRSGVR
jgi:hypothetical protein